MEDKSPEKLTPTEEFFLPLFEALFTEKGNIWEKIGVVVSYILVGIIWLAMGIGLVLIFLFAFGFSALTMLDTDLLIRTFFP